MTCRRLTRTPDRFLAILASVLFSGLPVSSARAATAPNATPAVRLVASPEAGWPQWRGPRRDGISEERGLLSEWPTGGPPLLWKSKGMGRGYSAPIVTGNRIHLAGDVGDHLQILTLDLQGQKLWQTTNGRSWTGPYPGARASCTFSGGRLYHLNAHGRVACLDPRDGREVWTLNVLERFGGKNLTWGLSENLLVDGRHVFVTAGGRDALVVAFDRETGAVLWKSKPLLLGPSDLPAHARLAEPAGDADSASYASPILVAAGGKRYLIGCSLRHQYAVNADTGELIWTQPMPTRYSVIAATPVLADDTVLFTAPDAEGMSLYRLIAGESSLRLEARAKTRLDSCQGGSVFAEGALFGSWYRGRKGWACIDPASGDVRYETKEMAMGPVLYADQRLYCLSQEGEMALLRPTPQGFEFKGRFRLIQERASDVWTHPVILDRRLYLRFHDTLFCYDVRGKGIRD